MQSGSGNPHILWTPYMDVPKRRRMKERTGNTTTTTANIAVDGPTEREKRDLSSLSLSLSTAQGTPEIGEWLANPDRSTGK